MINECLLFIYFGQCVYYLWIKENEKIRWYMEFNGKNGWDHIMEEGRADC